MTVNEALLAFTKQLENAGISTARLDVLVLLEDVLNTNRTHLLAHPERQLTDTESTRVTELLKKRSQHVPLAYLRNKTEFYGREFYVNEHVLEPRPESETMIDLLKQLDASAIHTLADIGSGSGALGITAALELPHTLVTLIEIDSDALAINKRNAGTYKIPVQLRQNDLLEGIDEHFDVLLCNLPYVPNDFHINTAASHEPRIALYGGEDGLDLYRRLFTQLKSHATPARFVLTESLPFQHKDVLDIAVQAGYNQVNEQDFIQVFELAN